jgi:hypothetical protein
MNNHQIIDSKTNLKNVEYYFFYTLLLLAISIIILPKFYLTGDGPSHVYNAKILLDYVTNHQRAFYKPFYEMNRQLDPNWTSQILLAIMLKVLPYWLADKCFQIVYVCLFAYGFRYLVKAIAANTNTLSLLFYPFCFTLPFQMGFYNYCLALSILFFLLGFFIKNYNQAYGLVQLKLMLGTLLLALTHGMVVTHFMLIVFLLLLIETISYIKSKTPLSKIVNVLSPICVAFFPAILIIISFAMRQGLATTPHPLSALQKLKNFASLYCCQSTSKLEAIPAMAFGIGLVCIAIYIIIKNNCTSTRLRNTFLLFAVYTFIAYINAPNTLGYAGGTDIRLAFLPPLFIVFALSTYQISIGFNKIILGFACIIQCSFLAIRYAPVLSASKEVGELLKIEKNIAPQKNILSIQFNTHGTHHQMELDNSFLHVFDYIGAMANHQNIILNNYEADLNYFSLRWRIGMNPRNTMPNIIIGKAPTWQQIKNYTNATKQNIDYIIIQKDVRKNNININADKIVIDSIENNYLMIEKKSTLGIYLYQKK